jgi:hypothetical protein
VLGSNVSLFNITGVRSHAGGNVKMFGRKCGIVDAKDEKGPRNKKYRAVIV